MCSVVTSVCVVFERVKACCSRWHRLPLRSAAGSSDWRTHPRQRMEARATDGAATHTGAHWTADGEQ